MKVVHFPYTYFPDAAGGTEVYVRTLCQELLPHGVRSVVAAPGAQAAEYEMDGQKVIRFPTSSSLSLRDLYGEGDASAVAALLPLLDREKPDVVNFHAYSSGVSLRLAREVKRRGIPFIQTYHTPTVSCMRGTLLYMGREICDGVVEPSRCSACLLEAKGLPEWAGRTLSQVAPWLPTGDRQGGAWTAARIPELAVLRSACFHELMQLADHVVAVCDWVAEVLRRNGVSPAKILVSRQGAPPRGREATLPARATSAERLRLIFMGRIDWTKGLHVVLEALARLPANQISLDIYGVMQGQSAYEEKMRRLAAAHPGVRWLAPVKPEEVVRTIAGYDALVVPSVWLETGPLVAYEAFAAGVPVIGSRLGGIAELVTHERDGLLVNAGDVPAWSTALKHAPSVLAQLQQGVRPPRTMAAAAAEMSALYRQVLERAAA
jgi:glycosyltransferase involved in cell wall biosynthesis